jgi:hypothetical protein
MPGPDEGPRNRRVKKSLPEERSIPEQQSTSMRDWFSGWASFFCCVPPISHPETSKAVSTFDGSPQTQKMTTDCSSDDFQEIPQPGTNSDTWLATFTNYLIPFGESVVNTAYNVLKPAIPFVISSQFGPITAILYGISQIPMTSATEFAYNSGAPANCASNCDPNMLNRICGFVTAINSTTTAAAMNDLKDTAINYITWTRDVLSSNSILKNIVEYKVGASAIDNCLEQCLKTVTDVDFSNPCPDPAAQCAYLSKSWHGLKVAFNSTGLAESDQLCKHLTKCIDKAVKAAETDVSWWKIALLVTLMVAAIAGCCYCCCKRRCCCGCNADPAAAPLLDPTNGGPAAARGGPPV